MSKNNWVAEFERDYLSNSYNIYLSSASGDSRTFLCGDNTARTVRYDEIVERKDVVLARLSQEQLQAMIDGLSEMGLKTNRDSVAEGKLQATERHLEDMRTIVMSKYTPVKDN